MTDGNERVAAVRGGQRGHGNSAVVVGVVAVAVLSVVVLSVVAVAALSVLRIR